MIALLLCVLAAMPASAARIVATITDEGGKALAMRRSLSRQSAPPDAAARLVIATIDRKDEMFMPEVVVVRTGGGAIFRDSDQVPHHVLVSASPRPPGAL